MRCDEARRAASLRFDGELGPAADRSEAAALDEHVAACSACADFERHLRRLRAAMRFEPVDAVPDVAPAVVARLSRPADREAHMTALVPDVAPVVVARLSRPETRSQPPSPRSRPRRPLAVAAALAAIGGMAAGAAFVGVGWQPRSPAAADLPERVVAAQADITSVDADFTLHERPLGGDADRSFGGRLVYEAPESLALTLSERATTGSSAGDDRTVRLVVDGDRWWRSAPRSCSPAAGRARCPDDARRWTRSVTGREPFADDAAVPLELVSPVDSFTLAATPASLGTRTIAGQRAIGVRVTAAQIAPFLEGLSPDGDLRPVYPGDPAEMWLDERHLVPLEVVVRAGGDPDRTRWATAQGASEEPDQVVLAFTVESVAINDPVPRGAFDPPSSPAPDEQIDAGFRAAHGLDGPGPGVLVPEELPAGFDPHRAGTIVGTGGPAITVGSWTDGRAWLTVRSTAEWSGDRLFGGLGSSVRQVDLGHAGVGYLSDGGRKLALHADGLDVVVAGSVPTSELQAAAASLGITGRPVPETWDEAATATLDEAAAATDGLLVASAVEGFGPPAVRITGDTTTQVYAGAGERGFTLVQRQAPHLTPPSDGDTVAAEVRGVPGRYTPGSGELEWVEAGTAHSLSSRTLSLGELLAIAARLDEV